MVIRNKKSLFICLCLSVIAIFFLYKPFYSVCVKGVFSAYIPYPVLQKDIWELLAYCIAIIFFSFLAWDKKGVVVLVIFCLYLLATGTLGQCLVSYAYIEIIIYIGRSFLSILTASKQRSYFSGVNFLVGSMVWGVCAIMVSLLQAGGIHELRLLTAVLLLLAIVNPKNHVVLEDFLVIKFVQYLNRSRRAEFFINLFFICIMMIACARVNTHVESDSYWYALYTDKCLFGDYSFYDNLGYTTFVYYYPKFKELLMAPISGLGLPGYLISSNLWIMILCMMELYHFMKDRVKGNWGGVFLLEVIYLIFSSVCIIGISGTAKSDTISYLYILLLILYFLQYLKTRDPSFFWISLSSGIMSYTVKFTSFLFSTIIIAFIFVVMTRFLIKKEDTKLKMERLFGFVLLAFAVFIFAGILYRTFKLTGFPTYRQGKDFWEIIGFHAKPYFDIGANYAIINRFELRRIYDVLFDVSKAEKITVQWTGNYSVFMGLCLLLLYRKRKRNDHKFFFFIAAALALLSLLFLVGMAGPDGNYFSVAIMISTCYILIRMTESEYWDTYNRWFAAVIAMFMFLNLAFNFATHPSWGIGTRFPRESVSLYMSEEEKFQYKNDSIKSLGAYEIQEKLSETDGNDFILSDGPSSMCMLNARIETAAQIFHRFLSGANIDNYEEFKEYVDYVNADGFIIARNGEGDAEFDQYVLQYIEDYGYIEQTDAEKYRYYKIRRRMGE